MVLITNKKGGYKVGGKGSGFGNFELKVEQLSKKMEKTIKEEAHKLKRELKSVARKYNKIKTPEFNRAYYTAFINVLKVMLEEENENKIMEKIENGELALTGRYEIVNKIIEEFEKAVDSAFRETEITKDRSKNQLPDFAFASNTEVNLDALLYDFVPEVKNKEQIKGVFGNSVAVRKEEHLEDEEDFTQFAYILNHNAHHNKHMPMLMFFAEETDGGNYLELIVRRRNIFLQYAKDAGWRIESEKDNDYAIYKEVNGKIKKTLLPLVIYNPENREFKVYHTKGKMAGMLENFSDWLERNKEIIDKELINYLKEKLEEHKRDEFASRVHKLRRLYQKVACVDSRHRAYAVAEQLKELGSIPKEVEIRRMFKHNYSKLVSIELHTTCGYITSAVMFHDLFKWIKENGSRTLKEAVLRQINNFVKATREGREYRMTLAREFRELLKDADESVRNTYTLLFENEKGDYQFILKHMMDVGLFEFDGNELPLMKTAEESDRKNSGTKGKLRVYYITEEIAHWLKERIENIRKEEIEKGNRHAKDVKVEIVIRSLVTDELIIPGDGTGKERKIIGEEENYSKTIEELV